MGSRCWFEEASAQMSCEYLSARRRESCLVNGRKAGDVLDADFGQQVPP